MSGWYKLILRAQKIRCGKGLRLLGAPVIAKAKGARILIGKDVVIKSSLLSNLLGLYGRSVITARTPGSEIIIGDQVGISGAAIYARSRISIGDGTLIGANVKILDSDLHPHSARARREAERSLREAAASRRVFSGLLSRQEWIPEEKSEIPSCPIQIGRDCFIGCNAIILKGTVLGDRCIVGAGAVVSGKFEHDSVIAGNPARVIRQDQEETA